MNSSDFLQRGGSTRVQIPFGQATNEAREVESRFRIAKHGSGIDNRRKRNILFHDACFTELSIYFAPAWRGTATSVGRAGETKVIRLEGKREREFYLAEEACRRDEFRVSPPLPRLEKPAAEALENAAHGIKRIPASGRSRRFRAQCPSHFIRTREIPRVFCKSRYARVRVSLAPCILADHHYSVALLSLGTFSRMVRSKHWRAEPLFLMRKRSFVFDPICQMWRTDV